MTVADYPAPKPMRVLIDCPCCGHTLTLRHVMEKLGLDFLPNLRVHRVRGHGRGRIENIITPLDPSADEGSARLVATVLRRLATQLRWAAKRLSEGAEEADRSCYRVSTGGVSVVPAIANAGVVAVFPTIVGGGRVLDD